MRTKYLMIVIAIPLPIPDIPNCSTAQQHVRIASTLGEAIGTGLRWECVKEDHLKRSIALIKRELEYLMEAFTSRGFYLYESAANFILVDISSTDMDSHEMAERLTGNRILVRACAMFQGPDGRYVRVAVRTREENQMLM